MYILSDIPSIFFPSFHTLSAFASVFLLYAVNIQDYSLNIFGHLLSYDLGPLVQSIISLKMSISGQLVK